MGTAQRTLARGRRWPSWVTGGVHVHGTRVNLSCTVSRGCQSVKPLILLTLAAVTPDPGALSASLPARPARADHHPLIGPLSILQKLSVALPRASANAPALHKPAARTAPKDLSSSLSGVELRISRSTPRD